MATDISKESDDVTFGLRQLKKALKLIYLYL